MQKTAKVNPQSCDESQLSVQHENRRFSGETSLQAFARGQSQNMLVSGAHFRENMSQVNYSGVLAQTSDLYSELVDPKNKDLQNSFKDQIQEPLRKSSEQISELTAAVADFNLSPEERREKKELLAWMLDTSTQTRNVFGNNYKDTVKAKFHQFSHGVDEGIQARNAVAHGTMTAFRATNEALLAVREQNLVQHTKEFETVLAQQYQQSEADYANAARALDTLKQKDAHTLQNVRANAEEHHRNAMAIQKREKDKLDDEARREKEREDQILEREKHRDALHQEAEDREYARNAQREHEELERERKREEMAATRALNDREAEEAKSRMVAGEREAIMREYQLELERYRSEFEAAQRAQRAVLERGGECRVTHSAPRVDWGSPPERPPTVVPGYVSYKCTSN